MIAPALDFYWVVEQLPSRSTSADARRPACSMPAFRRAVQPAVPAPPSAYLNEASLTYHVEQSVPLSLIEHQCRLEDHCSWREGLLLALHCAIPRFSGFGWG